jgi:flagellar motor switch protein FliM
MKAKPYDFRKTSSLSGDLEQRFTAWLNVGLAIAAEKWAIHFETPVTHVLGGMDTARPLEAIAQLSDASVGYRVTIGPEELQSLVLIPRPLVLTLAAGVLGDACTELLPDRNLTAVEGSLAEYLLQQFLAAIREAWPSDDAPALTVKEFEAAPKRTRIFPPDENVIRFSMTMRGSFGEESWQWLLPQKDLTNLYYQTVNAAKGEQGSGVKERLESLVGTMSLEVAVRLGGAVLHVSDLANLRSGDLVLLDQSVSNPLVATVAGETRFLVWPGRVGTKQAIQIESLVEC